MQDVPDFMASQTDAMTIAEPNAAQTLAVGGHLESAANLDEVAVDYAVE